MTTITLPRATVEQALEALEDAKALLNNKDRTTTMWFADEITALRAALAQQAEPVEPMAWVYMGIKQDGTEHGPHLVWKPEYMDFMSASKGAKATPLYTAPPQQAEPVQALNAWAADRLARHGIQACLYPQCVGGQSGTVCHKHCPTPCPDCRGIGYDASGQLCACQQNPSF